MKILKRTFFFLLLFVIIIIIGGIIYVNVNVYGPTNDMYTHLKSPEYDSITVKNEKDAIILKDNSLDIKARIIFYPGGKVKTEAYLNLGNLLAKQGYEVILLKPLFHLAIIDINLGEKYLDKETKTIVGGHSLGGTVATMFYNKYSNDIDGIFLLASYPNKKIENVPVISFYGSYDQIVDKDKYEDAKKLLPNDTIYQEITLGNHSYFGWYGLQKGDKKTSTTPVAVQYETAQYLSGFIDNQVIKK